MASVGALRRLDSQGNWITMGHTLITRPGEADLSNLAADAEIGQLVFCELEQTLWMFNGAKYVHVTSGAMLISSGAPLGDAADGSIALNPSTGESWVFVKGRWERLGVPPAPSGGMVLTSRAGTSPEWRPPGSSAVLAGIIADTNVQAHTFTWADMVLPATMANFTAGMYLIVGTLAQPPANVPGLGGVKLDPGDWVVCIDTNNDGVVEAYHPIKMPEPPGQGLVLIKEFSGMGPATITLDMDRAVYKEFEVRFQVEESPLNITMDGATVWLGVQHSSKSPSTNYLRNVVGGAAAQYAPTGLHTGVFTFDAVAHELHLKVMLPTGAPATLETIIVDAVGEGQSISQLVFNIAGAIARHDVILLGLR